MTDSILIMPGSPSGQLELMVNAVLSGTSCTCISDTMSIPDLTNKKIVFAAELNKAGFNIGLLELFSKLYEKGETALLGSSGIVLVHSSSQLNTKRAAQNIIFLANNLGCSFIGHPLVEATGSLENFLTWQKQLHMSLNEVCLELCTRLGERFFNDTPTRIENPNILALHSSSRKTSNTLALWHMVSQYLSKCSLTELHVENGEVLDCKGCSYKTCVHYSMQNSCFYGGVMVKDILPAIEKADAVLWICPNYNDALSANLTAVINRLTALYRKISFYNKTMFSVIVSGNSGSDSIARQLIGALNINKGFRLPPYFAMMTIANDPGAVINVQGIDEGARQFAKNIMDQIKVHSD